MGKLEAVLSPGLLVKRIFDKVDHGRLGYMTVPGLARERFPKSVAVAQWIIVMPYVSPSLGAFRA